MAIPLIVGLAAGAVGLYKGGKAIMDNNKAGDINASAKDIMQSAEKCVKDSREACRTALEELGKHKAKTLENNVQDFLQTFNQIKNVDFARDSGLGNLVPRNFNTDLKEMAASVSMVVSAGLGVGGGAVSGALVAFGAYNGTMLFAAAGTGTAISTLSGAAATNATLAWLGGGTIASGGMGVAGGVMALQALVAGPALLVAGWYMGSKAEANLNNARSNKEQALKYATDMDVVVTMLDGITVVAKTASGILSTLRTHARRNLKTLKWVIEEQGLDYAQYNQEGKLSVMKNVKIMQVIKAIIDTPILDEEGNLMGDAASNLAQIEQCVQSGFIDALPQK